MIQAPRIHIIGDPDVMDELRAAVEHAGLSVASPARMRGAALPSEIIIALGSAGVFSAFFQVLSTVLTRNKTRLLKITRGTCSLTISGHTLPEELELLSQLVPEFRQEASPEN
jgi:hypothetical protein